MQVLSHAPDELINGRLRRLGEGIGKVVYASEHWVVKRPRSPSAIIALIMIWKALRRVERFLPGGERLLQRPSRQLRFLRVIMQGVVAVVPKTFWYTTHVGAVRRLYRARDRRGEVLADEYLAGSHLVPDQIAFPTVRVKVGGWPGWLTVSEATERVEATLYDRLSEVARAGDFEEMEVWLNRFLDLRRAGWQRGLFSVDAHLKNYGVVGNRVVLLDAGGLTNKWEEVEKRLSYEDVVLQPHVQLGLGPLIGSHPEIACRFDSKWRAVVNTSTVRSHWPSE